jgi:hypothetical protein
VKLHFPLKTRERAHGSLPSKPRALADCYVIGDEIGRCGWEALGFRFWIWFLFGFGFGFGLGFGFGFGCNA